MRANDIAGITAEQIQDRFDLPYLPTHIVNVTPPEGTKIRTGVVNSGNFGGNGGATQYQLLDKIDSDLFSDARPLSE